MLATGLLGSAGMGAKAFTELAAWQRGDELRRFVMEVTARPQVARDLRFCDQCKSAARSVTNNIAEGSLQEVRDQMSDAFERGFQKKNGWRSTPRSGGQLRRARVWSVT
ncbi:MAG: four helix bundle protein [Acidobacteria bacterium]|nr:four helix bundle protein [Acidobacteriota bacterium]